MTTKCSECGGDHSPTIHALDGALTAWAREALRAARDGEVGSLPERLAMGQVALLYRREVRS